ncbi:hypothetical protein DB30_05067 [Enhygromyxa salina]|uniref:PDZ domain-containing protein n=1 Tax=Enhygromyxa salina TaxID=215803 RepID=A0A0C1ZXR7_9BACT|nr:hypothetical protein DB30_05067 [Enhygromyxa salina]
MGGFDGLDLKAEVQFLDGEFVVSELLIATALTDAKGVTEDGTYAVQLSDTLGTPYGFEIDGVSAGNLGDVLGLRDGDVIVEIAGLPTASHADLLAVAATLFNSDRASMVIERGGSPFIQRYRRGL